MLHFSNDLSHLASLIHYFYIPKPTSVVVLVLMTSIFMTVASSWLSPLSVIPVLLWAEVLATSLSTVLLPLAWIPEDCPAQMPSYTVHIAVSLIRDFFLDDRVVSPT